jgi:GGDEF domain-containing protein
LDLRDKITSANPKTTEVMIRTVCQMLSSEIRRTDILSRIDTNIFAMAAPKTSKSQAKILCKRLDQVLHRNLLGFGSPSLKVQLAVTNLIRDKKETAMDFLERSISGLQSAQE